VRWDNSRRSERVGTEQAGVDMRKGRAGGDGGDLVGGLWRVLRKVAFVFCATFLWQTRSKRTEDSLPKDCSLRLVRGS